MWKFQVNFPYLLYNFLVNQIELKCALKIQSNSNIWYCLIFLSSIFSPTKQKPIQNTQIHTNPNLKSVQNPQNYKKERERTSIKSITSSEPQVLGCFSECPEMNHRLNNHSNEKTRQTHLVESVKIWKWKVFEDGFYQYWSTEQILWLFE